MSKLKTTTPTPLEKLIVNEREILSFQETVLLKDYSVRKIQEKCPELSDVILSLVGMVSSKSFITVDVMKHNFLNKTKTCRDVSFHVDGVGNDYILWSIGNFRTEFLVDSLTLNSSPSDLIAINKEIKEKTKSITVAACESENSVPMAYDSLCVHRGRVATAGFKRIMVRICSSDYIRPKNIDLNKIQHL